MNVEIEVGDRCYELEVESYSMDVAPSRWDPGDGGEVEFGNIVTVWGGPNSRDYTTLNVFVLEYASVCGMSLRDAERAIHDDAYAQVCSQLSDAYEESRTPYSARDY